MAEQLSETVIPAPPARLEPDAIGVAQDTIIGMATSAPAAVVAITLASLAAVGTGAYYGGGINQQLAHVPRVPVMFHFGEKDTHIPLSAVDEIRKAHPRGIFHLYPAQHGFNCTDRASFDAQSAKLAFDRSVEFFRQNIG